MVAFKEFKSTLTESKSLVANKYFGPHEKSGPKYMEKIRTAMKSDTIPLEVVDADKQDRKIVFGKKYRKAALEALADHIETMKSNAKQVKAPVIKAQDSESGEEVTFQLDKIYKRFSKPGEEDSMVATVNMGNVTEGVVGLAFATRFRNAEKKVDTDMIIDTGKRFFAKEEDTIDLDIEERTEDKLELKITLPASDLKALRLYIESDGDAQLVQDKMGISDEGRKKLAKMLQQCANVANDATTAGGAVETIQKFYADGIKQRLQVHSDGAEAENQSATKVDLSLLVREGDGDKVIDTLSLISLKAGGGTSQIGQASGYAFDAMRRYWLSSFNYKVPASVEKEFEEVMSKYGTYKPTKKDPSKTKYTFNSPQDKADGLKAIVQGPIKSAFEFANEKIEKHIAGDTEEGEEEFLYHLQKGLLYHSSKVEDKEDKSTFTKGNEDVVVLILNPGGGKDFIELKFGKELAEVLKYFNFKSSGVIEADGGKGVYLRIEAVFKDDPDAPEKIKKLALPGKGSFLVQYRSAIKGNAVRNTVEIGTQSKVLANVENFIENAKPGDIVKSAAGNDMVAGIDGKATVTPATAPNADEMSKKIKAKANDPNAKVEENLMTPKPEFGPTFDIVDDLHIYMRNDSDAYRKSYYPMLCNMQKALENKEKISVKKMMMPTIKQCGADYNKKFGLASNIDEIMTMEQARELAKKIYDEEVPLMRKGAYK